MENVKQTKYGTREAVFAGQALMTKGKLIKEDLHFDEKTGRYKSVKAIERGKVLVQNLRKTPVVEPVVVEPVVEVVEAPVKAKRGRKKESN